MTEKALGIPVAAGTDAANVSDGVLGPAVLAGVPVTLDGHPSTPVLADRGFDSDPLRDELDARGYRPIIPHRSNRLRPSRNDGRAMRRSKRRCQMERAFAWVQSFRRVATRYERSPNLYDGFVALACAFIALGKL